MVGSTDTTIGNSRIALTVTAIAARTPSRRSRLSNQNDLRRSGRDENRAAKHPSEAEMDVMRSTRCPDMLQTAHSVNTVNRPSANPTRRRATGFAKMPHKFSGGRRQW